MWVSIVPWIWRVIGNPRVLQAIKPAVLILSVIWFYSWAAGHGERSAVSAMAAAEAERVQEQYAVFKRELHKAAERAEISASLNNELERQIDEITALTNTGPDTEGWVCVSPDITERLRSME